MLFWRKRLDWVAIFNFYTNVNDMVYFRKIERVFLGFRTVGVLPYLPVWL